MPTLPKQRKKGAMTRHFPLLIILILTSRSCSQLVENSTEIVTPATERPSWFRHPITNLLMLAGLEPGYKYNLMTIAATLQDLSDKNLPDIYQTCYDQHEDAFKNIRGQIFEGPRKCIYDPIFKIVDNVNNSYNDLNQTFGVLRRSVNDFREGNRIKAILEITTEEEQYIYDMIVRISTIVNTTFGLWKIPWCCYGKIKNSYDDLRTEVQNTVSCIRDKLGGDTELTESGDNLNKLPTEVAVVTTSEVASSLSSVNLNKLPTEIADVTTSEVASGLSSVGDVLTPPLQIPLNQSTTTTDGKNNVASSLSSVGDVLTPPLQIPLNQSTTTTDGKNNVASSISSVGDVLTPPVNIPLNQSTTDGKNNLNSDIALETTFQIATSDNTVTTESVISTNEAVDSNSLEDTLPPLISPQGWRPIRGFRW